MRQIRLIQNSLKNKNNVNENKKGNNNFIIIVEKLNIWDERLTWTGEEKSENSE